MRWAFVISVLLIFSGSGEAMTATCTVPGIGMLPSAVENFTENPGNLLSRYPNAERGLVTDVRSMAVVSPSTLSSLMETARSASREQRQAIGLGLGLAAAYCLAKDPPLVRRIGESVRNLGNRDVLLGYRTSLDRMDFSPVRVETMSSGTPSLGVLGALPFQRNEAGSLPKAPDAPIGTGRLGTRIGIGKTIDRRDLALPSPFVRSDPFTIN
jgi:hypothetical protein